MDSYVWDNFDPVLIENWDVSVESGSSGSSPMSSPVLELNFLEPSSDLLDLPIDVRTQLSPELLQTSSSAPHICISEGIFATQEYMPTKEDIPILEPAKRGRPKKKRQRSGAEESTDISAVILTREQLLKFSSKDLDDFARTVASQRPLTTAEEKELKRQRRLIKNRESAQASRERKRVFVDDLQGQIDELEAQLKKRDNEILILKQENISLKQKISDLLGGVSSTSVSSSNSISSSTVSNNDSHITISDMFTIKSSSNNVNLNISATSINKVKSAGVTLLIMLFSFGLLFNAFGSHKLVNLGKEVTSSSISHNIVLPPASIYQSVKSSSSSSLLRSMSPTTIGRSLQEHSSPTPSEGDTHKESVPVIDNSRFEDLRESKRGDVSPVHSDSIASIFLHEFANESKDSLDHKRLSEEAQQLNDWFNNNIDIQNNTAYLLTDEVQQLIHKDPAPFDVNSPLKISILIPSHHHTSIADSDNILLEVHCEVLDIKGHQVTANLVQPKLAITQ